MMLDFLGNLLHLFFSEKIHDLRNKLRIKSFEKGSSSNFQPTISEGKSDKLLQQFDGKMHSLIRRVSHVRVCDRGILLKNTLETFPVSAKSHGI